MKHVAEHRFNGSQTLPQLQLLPQHDSIHVIDADQEIHISTPKVIGHLQAGGHVGWRGSREG